MAGVRARSNFYLYGYTDKNIAGNDRYYRDGAGDYREIEWHRACRAWQVRRAFKKRE